MIRPIKKIVLSPEGRLELERRVRARGTPARDLLRARVILLRSQNMKQVAAKIQVSKNCVNKWSQRFTEHGIAGLHDAPGRGRKPSVADDKINRIITQAVQHPSGSQRWSIRSMARTAGVSAVFGSIRKLVADIETYLAKRNAPPRAYRWRADGRGILEKIQRALQKMEEVKAD